MLFFMELKFYKKFSKFSMELEYHRKLEFPISDKFLYISEKVINCNFFFPKTVVFDYFDLVMGAFFKVLIIFEDRHVGHIPNKLFSRSGPP